MNAFEDHIRKPVPGALSGQDYMARLKAEGQARRAERESAQIAPPGKRPRCAYCGRELRPYRYRQADSPKLYGTYGDNRFCGLRCGYRKALAIIRGRK